ncbi:cupin domain-containing protein [Rhodotorula paludigena]|uniref:cupin domain-containing protein n=1 Tax=Rhodotorula paludigena TaxID=86838 RepID=UPI0031825158
MLASILPSGPPRIRPTRTADGSLSYFDGGLTVQHEYDAQTGAYACRQRFSASSEHTNQGRKSAATPPMHVHLYEKETLEVIDGTMVCVIDGHEATAHKGDKIVIEPGVKHTFWRSEKDSEDLVMSASPSCGGHGPGFCESFARNFYGYLSSCVAAKSSPCPFQLFQFLDSAGVTLALPLGLGRLCNVVLGRWVGRYVFGFSTSYPEFETDKGE